jgi:hypothetical protein
MRGQEAKSLSRSLVGRRRSFKKDAPMPVAIHQYQDTPFHFPSTCSPDLKSCLGDAKKSLESAQMGRSWIRRICGTIFDLESVAGLLPALKQARRVGDVVAATSSKTEQVALNNCSFFSSCSSIQNSPYIDHRERKRVLEGPKSACGGLNEHQRCRLTKA